MIPSLSIRIDLPSGQRLGPGKVLLLKAIEKEGSVYRAAKALNMSHPRAIKLVKQLNEAFKDPLVITHQGGTSGGGAEVADMGLKVLDIYDTIERRCAEQTLHDRNALKTFLRD